MQQVVHAAGLGALLAGVAHGHRLLGGVDVELEVQHAVLERPADLVAGLPEHPDHGVVLGEHLGLEPAQAVLPGRGGQVFQQDRAEPAALVVVPRDERDLGRVRLGGAGRAAGATVAGQALVPPDRDDLVTDQADQRDPGAVVDHREPLQLGR